MIQEKPEKNMGSKNFGVWGFPLPCFDSHHQEDITLERLRNPQGFAIQHLASIPTTLLLCDNAYLPNCFVYIYFK